MLHPIVAQMQPNEEQEPAVAVRDRDVVVTAGAGTGKTRTLVARYLSLLAEGKALRSVVAITFTRKAAQEMRNRIRAEIRRYLLQPDLLAQERRRWDALYNELDAARIGTIHSLCTEILRAHPAEAAVDPRFEVLDEGLASILVARAVEETMAWAADDEAAVTLYALFGEWALRSILDGLMNQRLEARAAFDGLPDDPWPVWEAYVAARLSVFVDDRRVRGILAELSALRTNGILDRAEVQGDALAQPLRQLLADWDAILEARSQADWIRLSTHLGALPGNMKLVGQKAAWAPAEPKILVKELRELYFGQLGGWLAGVNLALDRRLAEIMPSLGKIFGQALEAYARLKRDRQALDFDDLEEMALRLLRDMPEARERWHKEVDAILVDEYQDTNGRQRDLVNLLNGDGGKLFIVGDAKQSIYRFRGADVTVFREERARIRAGDGAAFSLAKSYRAHQALIEGLNALLRPVLGEHEDPQRPWREPFAPLTYHRREPRKALTAPFIECHLTVGSKGDGALDRAAAALAGYLVELVEQEGSKLTYGDIAILCRASTSFNAYEDALDRLEIPYLTVAGRGFFDRPEIRDLLNALQALDDPTDDLALVGLLRSPVCGFSDADIFDLCQRWSEEGRTAPLWQTLQLREDGQAREAAALIARLHNLSGRIPVAGLLKNFLDETHYRAALLQAGYPRAARNVAKLLADAQASGMVSAREFLDYVAGIRVVAAREGEARATAGDVIRIMSVHAAKGLEFPLVVIGDINYDRKANSGMILDPELGAFPRLEDELGRQGGLNRLLQAQATDKEAAEADRLLYVAATRAQEKLILNGMVKLTQSGQPGWLRGWLKQLAGPLGLADQKIDYDESGDRAIRLDLRVSETPVACTIYEPGYSTSPRPVTLPVEGWRPEEDWSPSFLQPVPPGGYYLDDRARQREIDPPQRVWRVVPAVRQPRAPAWIIGLLVHQALANWRFPELGFDDWLKARARELGLLDNQRLKDAIGETERLLRRFREHPLYSEMNASERRFHEVPYSIMTEGGALEQGIIDTLYLRDGTWIVVDFKTDRFKDEQSFAGSAVSRKYRDQLRRYGLAVEQIIGQRPRAALCLLNYADRVYIEPDITRR